ncbi:MAG: hypothetical protein JJE28_09720, partial [Actinomycetales bacterium]|nr:hypothetical protein [Actinomycetales bacterium]
TSVLGAIFGGITALRETIRGPRDWRVILIWIGWGISVALAVGAVVRAHEEAEQARLEDADYDF